MRIDNHIAGYRPTVPKKSKKKADSSVLFSSPVTAGHMDRKISSNKEDDNQRQSAHSHTQKQRVHKREKIEKAAYLLSIHGAL